MNIFIKTINAEYEKSILQATNTAAVKISVRVMQLLSSIKEVQPYITGIYTGMGTWTFEGHGIGRYSIEDGGEEVKIDAVQIADVVKDVTSYSFEFAINTELIELVELLDYLTDAYQLNCSTWQEGFSEFGVVFYFSETADQNNPFSTRNKAYTKELDYYKRLVSAQAPILWRDYDLINPHTSTV